MRETDFQNGPQPQTQFHPQHPQYHQQQQQQQQRPVFQGAGVGPGPALRVPLNQVSSQSIIMQKYRVFKYVRLENNITLNCF